jgi:hypothetical protein
VDALIIVIILFVVRFILPFGLILLVGSLVKRSRPVAR